MYVVFVYYARNIFKRGTEVNQMMKVVGEEGTTTDDFILYLKSEFLDSVYFQQNSFDEVDAAVSVERQTYTFKKVLTVLASDFELKDKDEARTFFNQLRQKSLDWNYVAWDSAEFKSKEKKSYIFVWNYRRFYRNSIILWNFLCFIFTRNDCHQAD